MKNLYEARLKDLKDRMRVWGIDTGLVTDDDNVFYLTGYYDYLHMEFGRPTIFIVSENSPSVIITPQIDENSARSLATVMKFPRGMMGWVMNGAKNYPIY